MRTHKKTERGDAPRDHAVLKYLCGAVAAPRKIVFKQ